LVQPTHEWICWQTLSSFPEFFKWLEESYRNHAEQDLEAMFIAYLNQHAHYDPDRIAKMLTVLKRKRDLEDPSLPWSARTARATSRQNRTRPAVAEFIVACS